MNVDADEKEAVNGRREDMSAKRKKKVLKCTMQVLYRSRRACAAGRGDGRTARNDESGRLPRSGFAGVGYKVTCEFINFR